MFPRSQFLRCHKAVIKPVHNRRVHSSQSSPRRPGWQTHIGVDPEFMLPMHVLLPGHCKQRSDVQPSSAALYSLAGPTWTSYICKKNTSPQRHIGMQVSNRCSITAAVSLYPSCYPRRNCYFGRKCCVVVIWFCADWQSVVMPVSPLWQRNSTLNLTTLFALVLRVLRTASGFIFLN